MKSSARWWFAAFVVAVFFAGTSVGVIVDRVWLLQRRPAAVRPIVVAGERRLPAGDANRLVEANLARLRQRLELTGEQYDAVRPILEAWQQRVVTMQTNTRQQLLAETQRLEEELSPVLTPEQRNLLSSVRSVLLVSTTGRGRFGGPDEGRGGRGPGRGGPSQRPGGSGRE